MEIPFNSRLYPSIRIHQDSNIIGEKQVSYTYWCKPETAALLLADYEKHLEDIRCPSCHILWEQVWAGYRDKRHHPDCKWPEILQERHLAKIAAHKEKIALLESELEAMKLGDH